MTTLTERMNLPVIDIHETALLLDVDGTLLDIAALPDAVRVPKDLCQSLERLRVLLGGAVALVSGRALDDLEALFSPVVLTAVGCHGGEFRRPDGTIERTAPLPTALRERLAQFADLSAGIIVEDKTYTLAIHYRLAPEFGPVLLNALEDLRELLAVADLQVLHGKAVVEIKPRAFNKGLAIRRLMQLAPFKGRRPIFAGDDTTDRDVFKVLPEFRGTGISVGAPLPGASCLMERPRDLRSWLARLSQGDRAC